MVVLIAGFAAYRLREPSLREDAQASQLASYQSIGGQLFDTNCSGCHGTDAVGGSAPVLNAQEFLAGYWLVDVDSEARALEIAAQASAAPGPAGRPLGQPIEVRAVMAAPDPEV